MKMALSAPKLENKCLMNKMLSRNYIIEAKHLESLNQYFKNVFFEI